MELAGAPSRNRTVVRSAVVKMGLTRLAQEADAVVIGRVGRVVETVADKFEPFGSVMTYTDRLLSVEESLAGEFRFDEAIVRTLGGATAEVSMDAPDEPTFAAGERVVVFLCKDTGKLFELPDNAFTVLGLFQGKYTVREDESVWAPHLSRPIGLDEVREAVRSAAEASGPAAVT